MALTTAPVGAPGAAPPNPPRGPQPAPPGRPGPSSPTGPPGPVTGRADQHPPGRWSRASSPGWYRTWAVITAAVLAVLCAVGATAAARSASGASTIRNEAGPALLGVQDLFASESEANAAATAVVLTGADGGTEDRARLNLYTDAVDRSAAQTVALAALVGDDDQSQAALRRTGTALTTYAADVEAARRENALRGPNASADLQAALNLASTDMAQAVTTVTTQSRGRFNDLRSQGNLLLGVTAAAAVVALGGLAWLQRGTLARSNRILNVPMVVATALVVIDLGAVAVAGLNRSSALSRADTDGYQAVQVTSDLQSQAFQLQSDLSLRLLNGTPVDTARQSRLVQLVQQNLDNLSRQADTGRESAAVSELRTRWDRYQQATAALPAQTSGTASQRAAAIDQFEGPVLSTFNGFNTTIESVLLDNRSQFTDGTNRAAGSVGWLPWVAAVLPLLAAAAMVAGVQQRLGDYK